MSVEEYEYEEIDEWEDRYQISYTSGKPSPMKTTRKKAMSSWQRIEQLKDEAMLNRQIAQDEFNYYD